MNAKTSFILHLDSLSVLDDLKDEQTWQLLRAMAAFHHGKEPDLEPIVKVAFNPFKNQFIRDGKKGGRPKKSNDNPKEANGNQKNSKNPGGFSDNPTKAKKDDSGSGSKKKKTDYPPLFDRLCAGIKFPDGLGNKGTKSEALLQGGEHDHR